MSTISSLFSSEPSEPLENGFIQYGPGKGLIKQTFRGRDAHFNTVTKVATIDKSRNKIILIQPAEESLYLSGLRERGVGGYLYLFAHASPASIQGMDNATEIGKVITNSGIWKGEPIIIDACRAGAVPDGIASKLASTLRTYVVAPSTITWNYPLGGSSVGQGAYEELQGPWGRLAIPNIFVPGFWGIWGPDGKRVATTRASPRDQGMPVSGAESSEFLRRRP